MDDDIRLLLIVILAAAVGSYIHAATSFATYVGNQSFVASWTWWYLLRPFIGMALALVFYFVIPGGLLSVQSDAADFNPYGTAAVAGLVGIFSKQATDKLEEVLTNLFARARQRRRREAQQASRRRPRDRPDGAAKEDAEGGAGDRPGRARCPARAQYQALGSVQDSQ